ncbi:MAG: hypothetical protein HY886_09710 [Deltaproteobacteria bacterium]|nr:hypothetical protein [Deltaproteobacteria bacterium]
MSISDMLDRYFLKSLFATAFCLIAFIASLVAVVFYWAWSAMAMLCVMLFLIAWFYKLPFKADALFHGEEREKPLTSQRPSLLRKRTKSASPLNKGGLRGVE